MAKFCSNCGAQLNDTAPFCPSCGAPQAESSTAGAGVPAPGFSARVNDPEIIAAVKKNRKSSKLFALFLVPLPLVGFVIYSLAGESMELKQALIYGGIISAVFLVFALVGFIRGRANNGYEAVVISKDKGMTYRHSNSDSREHITCYTTVVKTVDGRKKKIVEYEGPQIWAYNYLNVGDRFRYHPQFNFPYELYDKSKAPYIVCVSCGTENATREDRCKKCGLPLLK